VSYGRFVGFKEQLRFFEYFYELALANHANFFFENQCAHIFTMCFLGNTQNFQARRGRFSHDPNFFFEIKTLRRVQKCFKKGLPSEYRKRSFFKPP
jgi:hypothetical protein